jgi:hypothetical protein
MGRPSQIVPTPSNDLDAPLKRFRLQPYHRRIIQLMVSGMKQSEISRRVGVTEVTISRIKDHPLFMAEYERLATEADFAAVDVMDRVRAVVPRALDIVEEFLAKSSEDVDVVKHFDRAVEILKMSHHELRGKTSAGGLHIHADKAQVNIGDVSSLDDDQLDKALEEQLQEFAEDA